MLQPVILNNMQTPLQQKICFTAKAKPRPIAIFGDIFERKTDKDALTLTPVKDWGNNYDLSHGFLTTAIGAAISPQTEIMAFDFQKGMSQGNSIKQIQQIIEEAIKIKKQHPDRPVSINFSLGLDYYFKQDDLNALKIGQKPFTKEECLKKYLGDEKKLIHQFQELFKTMKAFLSLPETKIYIASGNEEKELNLFLLADDKNLISVHATEAKGARLPFFSLEPFTNRGETGILNIYEDNSGSRFIVVNQKKISLDYEEKDLKNNPYTIHFSNLQKRISPTKENIEFVLGKDLKGRPFEEVKDNLLPIMYIVSDKPVPEGELTPELLEKLSQFRREFSTLNEFQQNYLKSKNNFYLPVNVKTNIRFGGPKTDLEKYYISDNQCLFIGVDKKGITYWSPDGTKPKKDAIVVGYLKGTSFSTPIALMKDFVSYLKEDSKVAFCGNVRLMPQAKKKA